MGIKYNPFAGNLDIVDGPSGDFSSLDISGDLTVDTTTLHVDSTNDRVGIGTTSPGSKLVIEDDTTINLDLNRTGAFPSLCRVANSGNVLLLENNVNGITFNTGITPSEKVRLDSGGRFLVGTSSALDTASIAPKVQSASADNQAGFGAFRYSANAPGPIFHFFKSRGASVGTNTIVQSGDTLGEIRFTGADGTNEIIGAQIVSQVDGTPGTNDMPGRLTFWTTADGASSPTERVQINSSGNMLLGGTASPASATKALAIFNGTAPTGSVTDGVVLYAEDVSSSSELKVRDEAGNVTTLSPHNFALIPEGPSEDMAWSYYSEKDGKRINVDMLKAIRVLERLSGEQLVFSS